MGGFVEREGFILINEGWLVLHNNYLLIVLNLLLINFRWCIWLFTNNQNAMTLCSFLFWKGVLSIFSSISRVALELRTLELAKRTTSGGSENLKRRSEECLSFTDHYQICYEWFVGLKFGKVICRACWICECSFTHSHCCFQLLLA